MTQTVKNWKEIAETHSRAYSTNDTLTLAMVENRAVALAKSEWPTANEEDRKSLSAIDKTARLGLRNEFGKLVTQYAQKSSQKVNDAEQKFKRCPKCGQIVKEEAHECKSEASEKKPSYHLRSQGLSDTLFKANEEYCPKCGTFLEPDFGCEKCGYVPEEKEYNEKYLDEEKEEKISPQTQEKISRKIGHLVGEEGKDPKQAAAIAYSMARERGAKVPEKKEEAWIPHEYRGEREWEYPSPMKLSPADTSLSVMARAVEEEVAKIASGDVSEETQNKLVMFTEVLEDRIEDLKNLPQFQKEEREDVDELVSDYDVDTADAFERAEARRQGEKVAPFLSLDEFRDEWIKYHGAPQSEADKQFLERGGLRDFWSDYLTQSAPVKQYFEAISKSTSKAAQPVKPGLPESRAKPTTFTGDDYQSKPIDEVTERKRRKKEEAVEKSKEDIFAKKSEITLKSGERLYLLSFDRPYDNIVYSSFDDAKQVWESLSEDAKKALRIFELIVSDSAPIALEEKSEQIKKN